MPSYAEEYQPHWSNKAKLGKETYLVTPCAEHLTEHGLLSGSEAEAVRGARVSYFHFTFKNCNGKETIIIQFLFLLLFNL